MPDPFHANFDNWGRINSFSPSDFPDELLAPEDMGEHLDGSERLTLGGAEYYITEDGNLIHPDIDVIATVELGSGVRLDSGVVFHPSRDSLPDPENRITVGDGTRVEDTEIEDGVIIGRNGLIRAQFLGASTLVGDDCKLRAGVKTQSRGVVDGFMRRVIIGKSVKIDDDSSLELGARIDFGVRLGYATVVGAGAVVEHNARVGQPSGSGPRKGGNRGGIVIPPGKTIAAGTVL
jgi:acetyltransferase-like isoleucine patch superfamily enzyme